jgi:siroheme synthase (precorrin-2 oxidase/ferrochelatase)
VADDLVKEAEELAAGLAQNATLQKILADHAKMLDEQKKENKRKQDEKRRQRWSQRLVQLGLMKHDDATLERILLHAQEVLLNHVPGDVLTLPRVPVPEGDGSAPW